MTGYQVIDIEELGQVDALNQIDALNRVVDELGGPAAPLAGSYEARVAAPYAPDEGTLLHVDGASIKDSDGRVVLLRGINVSGDSKVPPFKPISDATMLDPLPAWGFNTLRLLFTWEAYEPRRDVYDEDYLDYYEQVVTWAGERGLYVLVDFHQDAFSRFSVSGCGEGFPEWAIPPLIGRVAPDNSARCADWGTRMIVDLNHHLTWRYFHRDANLARSHYLEMVGRVAARLATYPNVIGYDLINEPWGNDEELALFIDDVGSAIREAAADTILFVPHHALGSSGLVDNTLPRPNLEGMAYSAHYYDGSVLLLGGWTGQDPAPALDRHAATASKWEVPLVLSEFGAPAQTVGVAGYMDALYAYLDEGFHHGMQWNYTPSWNPIDKDGWNGEDLSIVDEAGMLRGNFRPRPYPRAVAGEPLAFMATAEQLELAWDHDPALGNTELFLPSGYLDGRTVITSDGLDCKLDDTILHCSTAVAGSAHVIIE